MSGLQQQPGMGWSAEQQRLLSAMGYALYVRPGLEAVLKATDTAAIAVVDTAKPAGPKTASPAIPGMAAGHDRLLLALRRAAGGIDVAALVPDIAALRRDPLLKRALWPKLRALRRPH